MLTLLVFAYIFMYERRSKEPEKRFIDKICKRDTTQKYYGVDRKVVCVCKKNVWIWHGMDDEGCDVDDINIHGSDKKTLCC